MTRATERAVHRRIAAGYKDHQITKELACTLQEVKAIRSRLRARKPGSTAAEIGAGLLRAAHKSRDWRQVEVVRANFGDVL